MNVGRTEGMPRLRLASYNIHSGVGRDGRYDPHRTAEVLAEVDADVIALQEVDSRRDVDQFELFREATGFHTVPGHSIIEHRGEYGNVLLSRLPPLAPVLHEIGIDRREPRGVIEAELEIEGTVLRLIVTHLGLWPPERRRQIGRLLNLLHSRKGMPTVFMGDFNVLGPHAGALGKLGHPLGFRIRAPATFPVWLPFLALDRIWTVPQTLRTTIRAHRSALSLVASDHLPLVAELCIAPSGKPC